MDRREKRSRERLRHALIALLHEKDYQDIHVRELAERGDCGVATFYRQYENKEDLLKEIILMIPDLAHPERYRENHSISFLLQPENSNLLLPFLQFVYQERVFIRRLMHSPLQPLVYEMFYKMGVDGISTNTPEWTDKEVDVMAGCVVGNLYQWILLDLPYTPEDLASAIHMGSVYGILLQRQDNADIRDALHEKYNAHGQSNTETDS